ncbi:hypothetical protein [Achromobacter mucicolens]|uniref:hypothetical protein n=1 Tax=Achromobacter mucicolens TaxID=1389922 RepID=UPI00289A59D2|nr:hypothetical protein [Achromobacter mucicolens]
MNAKKAADGARADDADPRWRDGSQVNRTLFHASILRESTELNPLPGREINEFFG